MPATANELRQRRAKLAAQAKAMLDAAEAANKDLTAEESAEFDRLMAEADSLEARAERIEKASRLDAAIAGHAERMTEVEGLATNRSAAADPNAGLELLSAASREAIEAAPRVARESLLSRATGAYHAAFVSALRHGPNGVTKSQTEMLALQADVDITGGTLAPSIQFVDSLIKFVDDLVYIRQLATVYRLATAQALGAPSWDADPADADWTAEILTGSEDSTAATGKRELSPHPFAKRVKISNKLLRMTNAATLMVQRLGYKFGITEEKAFLTGFGAGQPLGVFTASVQGISTARDVSSGNTTNAIGADGLISAKYSLKAPYQNSPSLRWIFHRDAVAQIRKLKDSQNNYLWGPGLRDGSEPDRILDVPFLMSEYAPNTFTTGLYVGIIGDFRFYWIADALSMTVQRLMELYAETNQQGFIGRAECDAMPVLEEAFARVKLA